MNCHNHNLNHKRPQPIPIIQQQPSDRQGSHHRTHTQHAQRCTSSTPPPMPFKHHVRGYAYAATFLLPLSVFFFFFLNPFYDFSFFLFTHPTFQLPLPTIPSIVLRRWCLLPPPIIPCIHIASIQHSAPHALSSQGTLPILFERFPVFFFPFFVFPFHFQSGEEHMCRSA